MLKKIFDHEEFERLENYTFAKNAVYEKKNLTCFIYAEGINYLAVFLSDYLEKEIHELCDILLIRGQWTNNALSKEMSESLHQLLTLNEKIEHLDAVLSDDGPDGSRLKAALLRVDRDNSQVRYINNIISNINDSAEELLNIAAQQFSIVGKHLKNLEEDLQRKHPEMIINWRELSQVSRNPLAQQMTVDNEKIDGFIQLMNLCIIHRNSDYDGDD